MKSCEEYEIELSSLLDRELPPAAAAEALEHALTCAGCNHFYRAARRLQGATAAADAPDDAQLDPARAEELWRRVEAAGARSGSGTDTGLGDDHPDTPSSTTDRSGR